MQPRRHASPERRRRRAPACRYAVAVGDHAQSIDPPSLEQVERRLEPVRREGGDSGIACDRVRDDDARGASLRGDCARSTTRDGVPATSNASTLPPAWRATPRARSPTRPDAAETIVAGSPTASDNRPPPQNQMPVTSGRPAACGRRSPHAHAAACRSRFASVARRRRPRLAADRETHPWRGRHRTALS